MKRSAASPPLAWLAFHPFLLFAGYALIGALPAHAAPPKATAPETATPVLDGMIAICRLPPAEAQRAIAALPEDRQAAAALLCIGYMRGQLDLLQLLQGKPAERRSI